MVDERLVVHVRAPFDDVLAWVREALREHGFDALAIIDVEATLRAKMGRHVDRFIILGAYNPIMASRALDLDRRAVLLPCDVVVRAASDGVIVEAMAPQVLIDETGPSQLRSLATEARQRLSAALSTVADVAQSGSR